MVLGFRTSASAGGDKQSALFGDSARGASEAVENHMTGFMSRKQISRDLRLWALAFEATKGSC